MFYILIGLVACISVLAYGYVSGLFDVGYELGLPLNVAVAYGVFGAVGVYLVLEHVEKT